MTPLGQKQSFLTDHPMSALRNIGHSKVRRAAPVGGLTPRQTKPIEGAMKGLRHAANLLAGLGSQLAVKKWRAASHSTHLVGNNR